MVTDALAVLEQLYWHIDIRSGVKIGQKSSKNRPIETKFGGIVSDQKCLSCLMLEFVSGLLITKSKG